MSVFIEYLADRPEAIPTLAQWHYVQWSYLTPGDSVERRIAALQAHLEKGQIPTTFVALVDRTVVGSASLIAHDMDTRMHLSPWLASVYVEPLHRNRGIGSALVRRVEEEATALGVLALHLFTPDKVAFYTRLGWAVLEQCIYRGYAQTVMTRRLHR